MRKVIALLSICVVISLQHLYAQQSNLEFGVLIGLSTYQGDLIETDFYSLEEMNFGYGFTIRHHINSNFAVRANMLRGKISGSDFNYERRQNRGFIFSSHITEFSAQVEYDLLGHLRDRSGRIRKIVSPYIFAGWGAAFIDKTTSYNELNENDTNFAEIERDKNTNYKKSWFSAPFGLGAKINLNESLFLGLEWGARPVFSDLLDGISQSGNPDENDWYAFGGATISYRFNK